MLEFGVMLRPGHFPFSHMLTCMRVAEDAGFEFMWFGDSHLIWQEVSPVPDRRRLDHPAHAWGRSCPTRSPATRPSWPA